MELAATLDVAFLKPEMSLAELDLAVAETLPWKPATLCVRPCDVERIQPSCREAGIGSCVVLGFPHGSQVQASKEDEMHRYVELGVDEVDMVCSISRVRSGEWKAVEQEISAVAAIGNQASVPLKVIFETAYLEEPEIRRLCEICADAGAAWVKTSTGFASAGASEELLSWMLDAAAGRIQVKASGGIRSREQALRYLDMGVTRLGVGYGSVASLCRGEGSLEAAY